MVASEFSEKLTVTGHSQVGGGTPDPESLYRKALADGCDDCEALRQLGSIELRRRKYASALDCFDRALGLRPGIRDVMYMRGKALLGLSRFGDALEAFSIILQSFPGDTVVCFGHAVALMKLGRQVEALSSFDRLIDLDPENVNARINRGVILLGLGRIEEARENSERLLVLAPTSAIAHNNLGAVQLQMRRFADALSSFELAIRLAPEYTDALLNLGKTQRFLGRGTDALATLRKISHVASSRYDIWLELGVAFADEGDQPAALEALKKASALVPDDGVARMHLLMATIPKVRGSNDDLSAMRAEFAHEMDAFEEWLGERRICAEQVVGAAQPFCLAYQEECNRSLLVRYGEILARLSHDLPAADFSFRSNSPPCGLLRVGIVSAQIFNHSVWHALIKGWLACLDRTRYEIHLFSLGEARDNETVWAEANVHRFVTGAGDLRQWIEAICTAKPDVLIYPEIGMDPTTIRLACLRLAPVQAVSWGHPETSGLVTMDYFLSATALEPPNAQANYKESLVELPRLGCYLERRNIAPQNVDLPEIGIDASVPLLVCPGTPYKYAPEGDRLLIEIAMRLGRCRFVFFNSERSGLSRRLRSRLEKSFSTVGLVPADFLTFVPWQTPGRFLGLMKQAHVYLDTIGFSGFNTALQALDVGLPVVTREGRFLRGRLASGILRTLGLDHLVATSDSEYVALAVRLVRDDGFREESRRRIDAALPLLYQDLGAVRELEEFLNVATHRARSNQGVESFN